MPAPSPGRTSPLARLLLLIARVPTWFRVLLPVALWAAGTGLIATVPTSAGAPADLVGAGYQALRLFALDAAGFPLEPGSPGGLALWAVMLAAPLLTATAAADFVRRHVLSAEVLARGLSGHTVVCGLGNHGRVIARECARRGERVVVLDTRPGGVGAALDLGGAEALVLQGDMTERDAVLAAGVLRAGRVFLAAGDPLVNMEAARLVRALCQEQGTPAPRLYALVDECEDLRPILGPMGLRQRDMVDQFAHAARCLVDEAAVRAALAAMGEGTAPAHLVLVGFGRFGQAVLRALLQVEGLRGRPLRVELVDRRAGPKAERFRDAVEAAGWRLEVSPDGDAEAWVARQARRRERPGLVFLCVDNDPLSLRCGARLRELGGELAVVLRIARPMPTVGEPAVGHGVLARSVPELFGARLGALLDGDGAA